MTKDRYKSTINPLIKDKIEAFLKSGADELFIGQLSPTWLIDHVNAINGTEVDHVNEDRNGWQVDYWIPCTYRGVKYTLHGSAWYGFAEIYKSEDE